MVTTVDPVACVQAVESVCDLEETHNNMAPLRSNWTITACGSHINGPKLPLERVQASYHIMSILYFTH